MLAGGVSDEKCLASHRLLANTQLECMLQSNCSYTVDDRRLSSSLGAAECHHACAVAQGDVIRRFAQRTLHLAALCALLITFRVALLRLLGCAGHTQKPASGQLPVKRPRSAQDPESWYGRNSEGDSAASGGSAAAAAQPLLNHDLHARTWPAAGAIDVPCDCAGRLSVTAVLAV